MRLLLVAGCCCVAAGGGGGGGGSSRGCMPWAQRPSSFEISMTFFGLFLLLFLVVCYTQCSSFVVVGGLLLLAIFCYVVRDNVCDIILCDSLCDIAFFCYWVSYIMLFLFDFCCRCCWSVILVSNLPGKKRHNGYQWILLQINLEK